MKLLKLTKYILCIIAVISTHANALPSDNKNVRFLNSASPSSLPFSDAVQVGDLLILSGKIGINPDTRKLAPGGVVAEADQTLKNIANSLKRHGYKMSDVVKCTVMLTDINDFTAFNQVYRKHFSPPYPARSAFAVSALALNSRVEVECMAAR